MKRLTKNSLLSFLVVALLAIVCAFGVMGFSSNTAKADWQAPDDYSAAAVAESGFYFEEGAGVRTTTKGIKFQARVTEEFNATGDYTYFATAKAIKADGTVTDEQAVQFSALPEFVDGVAELNAYINFDNVSEAIWQTALAADWEVNAYAYDGANCIKAANGGEENLRSMRYVATSALLDWTEDAAYDKEDLTSYFTEANIQEGVNGYTGADGILYVSFAGAPEDATEMYVNTQLINEDNSLTYDADIARYMAEYEPASEMELGTINNAMMFTEDGKVYATKIAQGTPIASETDMLTYFTDGTNAKAVEGYYYLTADIIMAETWTYTSQLYGTLDGQGYTISNLKISNGTYGALFDPYGGTVRNIGISIASIGTHMGLVFGEGGDKCDSTVENVAIKVVPGYHTSAIVQLSHGGHHTIKNVILNKVALPSGASQATANYFTNGAADKTPSTWDIQNVYATANGAASGPKGVTIYDDFAALKNATDEIRTFEQNRAVKQLKIWISINQENAAEMQNFVAGQHMLLEEDVDVSSIASWIPAQVRMGAGTDGRIFIGNGHTVSGINITAHNASPVNASFFGGARGITVKDAGFKFNKVSGNNSGALFSNVTASTNVLQNVMISVDTFGAYGVGCVARSPEAGVIFNLNDVVFNFGTTSDNPSTPNDQLILGHTGQAATVNVNKVAIIRPVDGLTTLWSSVTVSAEPTIYDTLDAFVSGANTDADLLATAKQFGLIVGINQANAKDMFTAGLGGGYYMLEEDVNLDGATISNAKPRDTSKFTGFFNGQGYTISNVATNSLLAAAMTGKATVKNVGFYGIIPSGTGGVFAGQTNNNTASDILIEDVVVNMHRTEGSYGLLGQSVGMKVTFKNVVVNFENSNSASAGYVGTTSLSGTKIFDKFIGIGSIATHTAPGGTNATYVSGTANHTAGFYGGNSTNWGIGYEYGADGASAPVLGEDLYNFANYAAFEAQLETNAFGLSDNALALIAKTGLVRKITAENVGILRNVTNGTFYLTEDIDMSQVDLNGDAIVDENDVWTATQARNMPFVGTLDGQGHSITNLKLDGKSYNGFFGTVGGGALIKNVKIEAASQGHLNATLIGMINTGYAATSNFTLTNGGTKGEVNVVNTVISSKDLVGTKALVTVFYNSVPTIKLTDVVLMTEGTAYDAGYIVTDGGGNTANLTANNVLVVVGETDTSWLADGANTAETVLTGELAFAADTTSVGTMYAENATILGFFGLSPKQ